MNFLKKLLGKKPRFTDEQYERYSGLKIEALERVLGKQCDSVYHALIPFGVGGMVDLYCFSHAMPGTVCATAELLEPDGSGPKPSRIGTYELVACTKWKVTEEGERTAFETIMHRMVAIMTMVGRYAPTARLNPSETLEAPGPEGKPNYCLILDEYRNPQADFVIDGRQHGLLLLIEVFRSEMEYARQNGSKTVLDELKRRGYYPYSDLDRPAVF